MTCVKELVFRGEDETKLYACGSCGSCYSPKNVGVQNARDLAEKCCAPDAHVCSVCGVVVERYWTMCARHREQAALRRASPVAASAWPDPVEHDGYPGWWGEGYFSNVADFLESCADYGVSPPAYCWPCLPTDFRLNAESILESALSDFHKDAQDEIVDADALFEFLEAWNKRQTLRTWYPDHKRVVVLDEKRFAEMIA